VSRAKRLHGSQSRDYIRDSASRSPELKSATERTINDTSYLTHTMPSRSSSRGRVRTRSPYSDVPNGRHVSRSRSPARRSITPRSPSRSRSRSSRRNDRFKTESRSRSISRGRSPSPIRSTKACEVPPAGNSYSLIHSSKGGDREAYQECQ
jgi:hypothetical protein